jgi:hypothetical protein
MNLLLAGAMLFSGGSAVALQNDTVADTVSTTANQFMQKAQSMFKGDKVLDVVENGFPYPSEEYLSTLTEEQADAVISEIDMINATYNFSQMTDDEVRAALDEIRVQLHDLYTVLEIEGPMVQTQARQRIGQGGQGGQHGRSEDGTFPRGDGSRDGTCIEDEVTESDEIV